MTKERVRRSFLLLCDLAGAFSSVRPRTRIRLRRSGHRLQRGPRLDSRVRGNQRRSGHARSPVLFGRRRVRHSRARRAAGIPGLRHAERDGAPESATIPYVAAPSPEPPRLPARHRGGFAAAGRAAPPRKQARIVQPAPGSGPYWPRAESRRRPGACLRNMRADAEPPMSGLPDYRPFPSAPCDRSNRFASLRGSGRGG